MRAGSLVLGLSGNGPHLRNHSCNGNHYRQDGISSLRLHGIRPRNFPRDSKNSMLVWSCGLALDQTALEVKGLTAPVYVDHTEVLVRQTMLLSMYMRLETGQPLPGNEENTRLTNRWLPLSSKTSVTCSEVTARRFSPTGGAEGVWDLFGFANSQIAAVRETGRTGVDAVLNLKGELRWRWNRIFTASTIAEEKNSIAVASQI
jgi:hypothetical protein